MGMMGVFKWLRKDIVQRDRNRRGLTPKINGLNNEAYRNAIQAFIDRRRNPSDSGCIISPNSPDKERLDFFIRKNCQKRRNDERASDGMPGVPHVQAPEIFEIGWVAGTEDRLMELIFAEWQSSRVSLRRHTHPDCRNAVKADLQVLTEIRHPNVLLLMATTHTDDHGLVAIFESIDCTLYNYVHEQGERVSVQGIAKCAGSLAGALKHAHMRGYVHGAISSHCVFLATSGTVKLGGWELAATLDSPKIVRGYEERLRAEIFRWLAPEIFAKQDPTKATDVFGLTLLMWEMCTMNVPWIGLTKPEVERQYLQCERGVATDIYDFPPLLQNLLDAGLQLKVSKRTLDMSRMRRFLQTLEIQYEDADPLYIEVSSNNNNQQKSAFTPPIISPTVHRCTSAQTPKRYSTRKSIDAEVETCTPRLLNLNLVEDQKFPESQDFLSFSRNETAPVRMYEQILKGSSVEKVNARNVNKARSTEKFAGAKTRHIRSGETNKKSSSKEHLESVANATHSIDSTDDESCNDTRSNIKKLKQTLADKRENFFYGSDSSQFSPPEKTDPTKSRILTQVRSKDYEPHKPASHKTSLGPKQTQSTHQYNSIPSRSARHQSQISPYSKVPAAVRDAVVQPKVLNPNSESFFESSLWKKEKMICISKMRKSNDFTFLVSRFPQVEDERMKSKAESAESDQTYTIEKAIPDDPGEITEDSTTFRPNEELADATASTIPRSRSLQALKDALERATDIVRSTTPQTGSSASSPFKNPQNFEGNANTSAASESMFEHMCQLKHDELDSEIRSIERSASGEEAFCLPGFSREDREDTDRPRSDFVIRRRSAFRDEAKRGSFDASRLSSVVCESIEESWNENDHSSSSNSKPDDRTVIIKRSPVNDSNTVDGFSSSEQLQHSSEIERCHSASGENKQQDPETSFALMVFNDKTRGCNSCNRKSSMARRRSLPAALGQLKNLSNISLGKLPIRKADVPDNTVEDLYIDDEFGDSLNVNMVLLDGETSLDDEDFLPDLLELSDLRDYQ